MGAATICLLLIFLNPRGAFNPIQKFFLRVAYPIQKTFYILGRKTSDSLVFLGSIRNLRVENEKLIRENHSLAAEMANFKSEQKENAMLREQLSLAPKKDFNLEASFVIGQDPQRLGSWLLIDKGNDKGIKVGMPVIAFEGILIGKISEVNLNSSKVDLLSFFGSAVNAIDVETNARGVVKGEYGLGIIMDMISQSESLNEGDIIVTSGLGSDMPKGLLIGKIQEIRQTGDKLFQQAIVMPRVKYSKLDMVFVVK